MAQSANPHAGQNQHRQTFAKMREISSSVMQLVRNRNASLSRAVNGMRMELDNVSMGQNITDTAQVYKITFQDSLLMILKNASLTLTKIFAMPMMSAPGLLMIKIGKNVLLRALLCSQHKRLKDHMRRT